MVDLPLLCEPVTGPEPATAAGAGQDVVHCGRGAKTVAAAAAIPGEHTRAGPGRSGGVPPFRDEVPYEAYHRGHRVDADQPVWLGLMYLRDLAYEHPDGVAETDPVERTKVRIDDQYGVDRILPSSLVAGGKLERLPGVEPGCSPWQGDALTVVLQPHGAFGATRTHHSRRTRTRPDQPDEGMSAERGTRTRT